MIRIDFFDDEELAEMVKLVKNRLDEMAKEDDSYFDGLSLLEKLEREQQRRKEIADGESETCNIL